MYYYISIRKGVLFLLNTDVDLQDPLIIDILVVTTDRGNGGFTEGATKEKYANCKIAIIVATNETAFSM